MGQSGSNHIISGIVDGPLILEAHFHFRGMDIDVNLLSFYVIVQAHKRIFMLHHIGLVGLFNGFHQNFALYISAVDVIIFKIPVSPGNHGFPDKTLNRNTGSFKSNRHQFSGNVSAVNAVNHIFQIGIAGGMQLGLTVYHVFKRNILMGQGKLFHVTADVSRLCHGGF